MENQTNTSNQNSQPVGQNPVTQQTVLDKPKTNFAVVFVVGLVCSLVFGVGGYYLGKQSTSSKSYSNNQQTQVAPTAIPEKELEVVPSPNTVQESTYSNQYFSFTYPKTWQIDNTIIYEYRSGCDPDTFRCTNEKNIVDIRSNTTQMYQSYTNPEWFNKISALSSPWETGRDVFTKLTSGQTQEGKTYIIFKQGPSSSFEGEPLTLIVGYVLNNNHIYELRLSRYSSDPEGLQLLKSMLQSLKVK